MKNTKYYIGLSLCILIIAMSFISCNKNRNNDNGKPIIEPVTKQPTPEQIYDAIHLRGVIGNSKQFSSGWIDLDRPFGFRAGDSLIVTVGGTANRIKLRLLRSGGDPNNPADMVGRIHEVNKNGQIHVKLSMDYQNIIQVSVHGGSNPFGVYPLGEDNGPATMQRVIVIR